MKKRILIGLILSFVASLGVYTYAYAKETEEVVVESHLSGIFEHIVHEGK